MLTTKIKHHIHMDRMEHWFNFVLWICSKKSLERKSFFFLLHDELFSPQHAVDVIGLMHQHHGSDLHSTISVIKYFPLPHRLLVMDKFPELECLPKEIVSPHQGTPTSSRTSCRSNDTSRKRSSWRSTGPAPCETFGQKNQSRRSLRLKF